VQFFEKRRRKAGGLGWFTGGAKQEEEICWEKWRLEVTLATPKTESGECVDTRIYTIHARRPYGGYNTNHFVVNIERTKVTKAMGMTLQRTALKIVGIVNQHKDHIPPITTSEANPFPYQIDLNPRVEGWAKTIGMY
jgi:autophagy-related protein 101